MDPRDLVARVLIAIVWPALRIHQLREAYRAERDAAMLARARHPDPTHVDDDLYPYDERDICAIDCPEHDVPMVVEATEDLPPA